jgi:hypothetical protein
MKTTILLFLSFFCILILTPYLSILKAQDKLSDTEVERMRKASLQRLANPQALKYDLVDVQLKGEQFVLKYILNEPVEDEYQVAVVFLREKDSQFKIIPRSASGAIGKGRFAGKDNTIVWNYKSDYPTDLNGDDFYFILDIRRVEQSSTPWTWIGIGTAAVAGGVAYLLLKGKKETTPEPELVPPLSVVRPN